MTQRLRPTVQPALRALTALAAAAGLLAGCGSGDNGGSGDGTAPVAVVEGPSQGPLAGVEVGSGFPAPKATLTSSTGEQVPLGDVVAESPVTVFFFGYTLCPDVCPLIMADLSVAVSRLPQELRDDVQVAFVTSDPARDTPEVLRRYLARYDPDFVGFTGNLDTIVDVALGMGIAVDQGKRLPSGGYEVTHGAELVGYVEGEGAVVWTQPTSVDALTGDLILLAEQASDGSGQ